MRRLIYLLLFAALLAGLPAQAQQAKRPRGLDEGAERGFGRALAFSGGEAFIGEPSNVLGPGAVYVYAQEAGVWTEGQRLTASDATFADEFGWAMAVEDDVLLVGAPSQDGTRGAAYVFRWDTASGQWVEEAKLTAQGGAAGDELGTGVALWGAYALVGAPFANGAVGAAYLFRYDAGLGVWQQEARLTPAEALPDTRFGYTGVLSDGEVLVSAYRQNDSAGAVYVFRQDEASGAWQQHAQLSGNDTAPSDVFGFSMAWQGDELVIGAPQHNGFRGAAYLFQKNATTGDWEEQEKHIGSDLQAGDRFGWSMALAGDELWIAALLGNEDLGEAYVFERDDPAQPWREVARVSGSAAASFGTFGRAVALGTPYALVGANNEDLGAGAAYLFQRQAGGWAEQARLISSDAGPEAIVGEAVACAAGKASIFPCGSVDLMAYLPTADIGGARGAGVNDLWGWTDPETGHEYALVGRVDGTGFVDVTDPVNPVYLGTLPTHTEASTWRDIKTYADHAFIVSEALEHGVQIFDLTQLRAVADAPVTFEETAHYDAISTAHNIAINEETGFAYVVGARGGGNTCGGGLHMVDIQDPVNPTFAGCFADPSTGLGGTGYSHDAQCVVYQGPDAAYRGREICFGSNETALSISDVTDKRDPVALAAATYPDVGYAHQGWLTDDQRYFFLNDELDELRIGGHTRTLVWDVADLDDPQLFAVHEGVATSTDHNLYIVGRHVFQSNYASGLRILDITDVATPREVGYFDVFPAHDGAGFNGSWSNYPFFASGTVVVTGREAGLFIVKPTAFQVATETAETPASFALSAAFPNPFNPQTTFTLTLARAQPVTVSAYDVLGRAVALLHRGPLAAGTHRLVFDAEGLPSGVYLIRADAATASQTQTVTLVR